MATQRFGSKKARVEVIRDFPPGCGTISSLSSGLKSVRDYTREFPSGCGTIISPNTTQINPRKRLASEKDCGFSSGSSHWRRPVAAVRSKPPLGSTMVVKNNPQQVKAKEAVKPGERKSRERVMEMLKLFRERCEKISRFEKGVKRVDMKAHSELRVEGKIVNQPALMIGSVPGVEVGDRFYYRIELIIVGLHRLLQGGIDSMEFGGCKVATCIVANEGHFDKLNDPNVLIYMGEGGTLQRHEVGVPPDQLLKGGNRALWNSMREKKPVRVVRGLKLSVSCPQKIVYVYDGLYGVEACEKKKGPQGNMIFEFKLTRNPGQTTVPWKTCRWGRV